MATAELHQHAEQLLDELMAKHPLRQRPVLQWKGLRVSAGMAYYRLNTIGLSRHLLTDEERLSSTLVHEYAHLLAVERHGDRAAGHGPAWRQAMHELGAEPHRTHNYEVARNARRQSVRYQCARCGQTFERTRRFARFRKYVHVHCGGVLKLIEIARETIADSAS